MEETMTSTSPDHHQHIADVPKRALAMTSMTNEDYRNTYWPQLQTAIDRLLQGPPPPHHTGPVIEFEPMYSAAYKCVCQQHSEALYNDLMSHVHKHFVKVAEEMQQLDEFQLIDNYYCVIHRVMYSLDGIIPIFTYLNKVYVSTKLSSNLRTELQTLFCTDVIDPVFAGYIPGVLPAMREHELSGYISETQELQASLRQSWITSSSQGRKRCLDEEMLT
ncbi:CDK2-associated and cullin domain-containing protein 1-like [Homarus americanus]|uniref:CDK2-associated and cullin domain-containing protein 1-like n=1 Tax=Homarus americanus TaxID=6706 RepID=A0A8J5NCP8_HOMAM|nr:CDK2-associated and cullin domain-containing protein 1-like [Homarus americanus]